MNNSHLLFLTLTILLLSSSLAQRVALGVVNEYLDRDINVLWIDPQGRESLSMRGVSSLVPLWITSVQDHEFVARDANTGEELGRHIVDGDGLFVIRDPNSQTSKCNMEKENYKYCLTETWDYVETDPRLQRSREIGKRDRLDHNANQPALVPKFTETGFAKIKTPPKIWDIIIDYYNRNKITGISREAWTKDNTVVNFWDAHTWMVHLPETGDVKPRIYQGIAEVLEEWSGVELEPTSMYGIRLYLNNSYLENHLDRLKTHVISTIINVDQDVDEPWFLEIYDHAGNKNEIEMAPGDMVLYESAACVHGRPKPLKGRYYANFFTHFRPVDKSIWNFKSDNYHTA